MKKFILHNTTTILIIFGLMGAGIGYLGITQLTTDKTTASAACQGTCVALQKNGMLPNELAVKVGERVTFYSADGEKHNLAEGVGADDARHAGHDDPGHHEHIGGYTSGDFGADEAWRVQFKKAGTYKIHDHYNPKQNIVVVVY